MKKYWLVTAITCLFAGMTLLKAQAGLTVGIKLSSTCSCFNAKKPNKAKNEYGTAHETADALNKKGCPGQLTTDRNGAIEWAQDYGVAKHDEADALEKTKEGFFLACKTKALGIGQYDTWVYKANNKGGEERVENSGDNGPGNATSHAKSSFDNFTVLRANCSDNTKQFVCEAKPNLKGDLIWEDTQEVNACSICKASSLGSFNAGSSDTEKKSKDFFTLKINEEGMAQRDQRYSGSVKNIASYATETLDNRLAIHGSVKAVMQNNNKGISRTDCKSKVAKLKNNLSSKEGVSSSIQGFGNQNLKTATQKTQTQKVRKSYEDLSDSSKGHNRIKQKKINEISLKFDWTFGAKVYRDDQAVHSTNFDWLSKQNFYQERNGYHGQLFGYKFLKQNDYEFNPKYSAKAKDNLITVKNVMDIEVIEFKDRSFLHTDKPELGDFEIKGFNDTLKSELVGFKRINEDKAYFLIATESIKYECHACAPILGFVSVQNNQKTTLEFFDRKGKMGNPPEINWEKLGPDQWGFVAKTNYMAQGIVTGKKTYYDINQNVSEVLSFVTFKNNKGQYSKDEGADGKIWGFESDISKRETGGKYYDIIVRKKGTKISYEHDTTRNVDTTLHFGYQEGRYVNEN